MRRLAIFLIAAGVIWTIGCGGGSSSSSGSGGSGGGGGGGTNNVQAMTVNSGPAGVGAVNEGFVSVTVCAPGSSSQCQTVDNVLVDTGSTGLRLLSSVLTISLPQENDSNGNTLADCTVFIDGYIWGTVATADVTMAGEKAASVPVNIILAPSASPPAPGSCSSQSTGSNEGTNAQSLGANGILGVGFFQQDCGLACTTANSSIPDVYYACQGSHCNPSYVTLSQQVANPVSLFAGDNNGILIQMPTVPDGGSPTASGSLIFGIGTESNNALGSAVVYTVPDSGNHAGDITSTYKGHSYAGSFVDSGSNGLFFLDTATTGIPTCPSPNQDWYCPSPSPMDLSATIQGSNNATATINFTIENADTLFNNSNNTAYSTLSGTNPGSFDWGLPFFYGRNVYVAIENMSTSGGSGPYLAF